LGTGHKYAAAVLILALVILPTIAPIMRARGVDELTITVSPDEGRPGDIFKLTITNYPQGQYSEPSVFLEVVLRNLEGNGGDYHCSSVSGPPGANGLPTMIPWKSEGGGTWSRSFIVDSLAKEGLNTLSLKSYGSVLAETLFTVLGEDEEPTPNPTPEPGTIYGSVEDGHVHPLSRVRVVLYWDYDDGAGPVEIASTFTDNDGEYLINDPQVLVPMPEGSRGLLTVYLRDEDNIIQVVDESVNSGVVAYCEFGDDIPRTTETREWFEIESQEDLERNLIFPVAADLPTPLPQSMQYQPGHCDDNAITYYYTYLAVRFYRDFLGVTFGPNQECDHTPLPIWTWSSDGTYFYRDFFIGPGRVLDWRDPIIYINEIHSSWNNSDAPKNLQWHEFSHYVMCDMYDPSHPRVNEVFNDQDGDGAPEPGEWYDVNLNGQWDEDVNHGPSGNGYQNNLVTTDSWNEGFAEFMGCVIADWAQSEGHQYIGNNRPAHHYPVAAGFAVLEDQHPDYRDEELSVASILWDIYDGVNRNENDILQIPLDRLWLILTTLYKFPRYWQLDDWRMELSGWRGDVYTGGPGSNETEIRYIACVKDLYDALQINLNTSARQAVDAIFKWHDVYVEGEFFVDLDDDGVYDPMDIWLTEFDLDGNGKYTGPGEKAVTSKTLTSTVTKFTETRRRLPSIIYEDFEEGDDSLLYVYAVGEAPSLSFDVAPEAKLNGTYGLSINVEVTDWAGVMIEKTLNASGTTSIIFWSKALSSVSFRLEVFDRNGLWVSPALQGRGDWTPYTIPFAMFTPDPVYGPTESNSFDNTFLEFMILNYTTPGSYSIYLDTVTTDIVETTELNVEEEEEVSTEITVGEPIVILGIGCAGKSYRRNVKPLIGSLIQVHANELPATLVVKVTYNPPYEALDFTYTVNITRSPQDVNLFAPNNGTLTITLEKNEQPISHPIIINSTAYWQHIGEEEYLATMQTALEYTYPAWFTGAFPFLMSLAAMIKPSVRLPYTPYAALTILFAPIVALITAAVLLPRRRRGKKAAVLTASPPTVLPPATVSSQEPSPPRSQPPAFPENGNLVQQVDLKAEPTSTSLVEEKGTGSEKPGELKDGGRITLGRETESLKQRREALEQGMQENIRRRKALALSLPEPVLPRASKCVVCDASLTWIPQYQRWYCQTCREYR